MDTQTVVEFYQRSDEHSRMANTPLEYLRNKEIIARYLPPAPGKVLDVGGATGAYSFWLAEKGHSVTLVDLTPKHIEQALEIQKTAAHQLSSALVADARDLPFPEGTFDVVLLMGPLYHLVDRDDRAQALREAHRVAKVGGTVLVAAISRYASMMDGFFDALVSDPEFVEILARDLLTGLHRDTSRSQRYFTDAYLHLPEELELEIRGSGLRSEGVLAVTGFGWLLPGLTSKLADPVFRDLLLNNLRTVESRPELMGVSSHFMAIGRK